MKKWVAAAACIAMASAAPSASNIVIQPIRVGAETVRYNQGVPTLDLEGTTGAVQITPLPMDHGSLVFGVAVLNRSDRPANFDITNFMVRSPSEQLQVLSKDRLEAKAKNRAMWAQIALAAAGGLTAAAAASQRDTYRSTLFTPRGTYRAVYSAPSAMGQVQATAIAAGTGVGIAAIQSRLDETRRALGENIVQLTTVDPDESYAGQIVLTKMKTKSLPARIDLVVSWNGETYPFAWQVAKSGTPAPIFDALTQVSKISDPKPIEDTAPPATVPTPKAPIPSTIAPAT